MTIEIHRCLADEVPRLMRFLDEHWQKGHVLSSSRELMDWQHGGSDGAYDYLVALQNGELVGVLGYIATRRFDPVLTGDNNVLWLALWKVREDVSVPGLGLRLLRELGRVEPHGMLAVNGINLAHPPMYRALGYEVAELTQYFVTHPERPQTLLSAPQGYVWPIPGAGAASWQRMREADLEALSTAGPWMGAGVPKTPTYFLNRFLRHPFYRYHVHLIQGSADTKALLASRVVEHDGTNVLRLVDFAGAVDLLAEMGGGILGLMDETEASYADLWIYGVPEELAHAAGFQAADPEGSVTVPNYFEPFLSRNGRIVCAFKKTGHAVHPTIVVRADGDQDRPNRLRTADADG